jgi:peptidoglycan-N-acetylmuramic acid deacetylase
MKRPKRPCALLTALIFSIFPLLFGILGGPISAGAATAISHGDRGVNKIALTFDDGYKCDTRILDFHEQRGIKATAFVIGGWARQNASLIRRMDGSGWEVCNHTETHPVMTKLSNDQILAEINACQSAITSITGKRYPYFRPPYGAFNERTLAVVEQAGYKNIIWGVSDGDTVKNITPQTEIAAVLNNVKNGSIILMHFGGYHTGDILPTIVDNLLGRGYRFVTTSELLGDKVYDREDAHNTIGT